MNLVCEKQWLRKSGRVVRVDGQIRANLEAALGELVYIENAQNARTLCEVIGFDEGQVRLMPFSSGIDLRLGQRVVATGRSMEFIAGPSMLGRVVNCLCEPIDGAGDLNAGQRFEMRTDVPPPLSRPDITLPLQTGVRAIDGFLTIGRGQRMGLFAGSGVGKSTLLGEITKHAESDVCVVAMIGERGREVRPFVEKCLGKDGLSKSIVIVSTSDQPPLARVRACDVAVAIANQYRRDGKNVLLVLDSLSRLAYAQREMGLSLGEPPTSRGYTPSVFQKMAELLEQMGTSDTGSITGLLTVLVDGDDMNEPIADAARSILDGHIVLDRALANKGHYPAISILQSASRLFNEICSEDHRFFAMQARAVLAKYQEIEDLIQIGAYQPGAFAESDRAIAAYPHVNQFLRQDLNSPVSFEQTGKQLHALNQMIG